jgi:hypothetical protein
MSIAHKLPVARRGIENRAHVAHAQFLVEQEPEVSGLDVNVSVDAARLERVEELDVLAHGLFRLLRLRHELAEHCRRHHVSLNR